MNDKLKEICAVKREYIERLKKEKPFNEIDKIARESVSIRKFANSLRQKTSEGKLGIIAEIKKASPSAGIIREDFNPEEIAKTYEANGAACISVLTDTPYFQGKNEDLMMARNACSIPVLRKDFILDAWQIAESRAIGADCILLIMAALGDSEAEELHSAATEYRMEVLIESHDQKELERALRLPSGLIGINNRNLKTLKTDLKVTEQLAPLVPKDRIIVSESGIKNADDVKRLKDVGVNCFLMGESLLKQDNIANALKKLTQTEL